MKPDALSLKNLIGHADEPGRLKAGLAERRLNVRECCAYCNHWSPRASLGINANACSTRQTKRSFFATASEIPRQRQADFALNLSWVASGVMTPGCRFAKVFGGERRASRGGKFEWLRCCVVTVKCERTRALR
jgi:hypothetical protein